MVMHVGDGLVDLATRDEYACTPGQVESDRARVHGKQFQQLVVATGLEQGAVAQGRAGEEGAGAAMGTRSTLRRVEPHLMTLLSANAFLRVLGTVDAYRLG